MPARPVSVATVDRSRAVSMLPRGLHTDVSWSLRTATPQTRHPGICACRGNAGPSDALRPVGTESTGRGHRRPTRSPVRNRFPQGRWTDCAGRAGCVNKSGAKNLLAGCYVIDPQQFFLRTSQNESGSYPRLRAAVPPPPCFAWSPSPVNRGRIGSATIPLQAAGGTSRKSGSSRSASSGPAGE
jgi:hypothetical protein